MRRTLWKSRASFLGEMAGLGLFLGSFPKRSADLACAGLALTALCALASSRLACPNCGERPPFFSKEAWDLFDPRWQCAECDHEL
jgi:hypothetical protein